MNIPCRCGGNIEVKLHKIVYSRTIVVNHVPVHTCELCEKSELDASIKDELVSLISTMNPNDKQTVQFDDVNEFALLLKQAVDPAYSQLTLAEIVEERINQLLDMLLLSSSLQDEEWSQDIHRRLSQIAYYALVREYC